MLPLGACLRVGWYVECRARGISAEAARQALVFSFGAEVVQHMKYPALVSRVQADVASTLRTVEQFAA